MSHSDYSRNVFINCPFDEGFEGLFLAILFTVLSLELNPKSARIRTGSEIRVSKIFELIRASKYGIHDLSRVGIDEKSGLPRFNMPFELGLDLGCQTFSESHRDKAILVMESSAFEYQKYLSDILGYDPRAHDNNEENVIQIVSDWIRSELHDASLPNGKQISRDFIQYKPTYQSACENLLPKNPAFIDVVQLTAKWINDNNARREAEIAEKRIKQTLSLKSASKHALDLQSILDILSIIDHQGRQFERTPTSYKSFKEEDLRNVILVGLNARFKGSATGETFSGKGKSDIHINIAGDSVVAECKIWGGEQLYLDTITQLLKYLLWRHKYGVIITFFRNKNLSTVLKKVPIIVGKHESFRSIDSVDNLTHFVSSHKLNQDDEKNVQIHHLFYNLCCE